MVAKQPTQFCESCGKPRVRSARHCWKCSIKNRRPRSDPSARFWPRVKKTDTCWLWQHFIAPNGYGMFWFSSKMRRTHRVAYELTHGTIPHGLDVLHKCDVKACVNPAHLFLGTHGDNTQDAMLKGRIPTGSNHWSQRHPERYRRGVSHPFHKFTDDLVRHIRTEIENGARPTDLARQFNVSRRAIYHVVQDGWKHVK